MIFLTLGFLCGLRTRGYFLLLASLVAILLLPLSGLASQPGGPQATAVPTVVNKNTALGAIPVLVPGKEVPKVGFNPRLQRLTRVACIRDTGKVLDCDGVLSLLSQGKFEVLNLDGFLNFGMSPPVIWLVFQIDNQTEMGSNSFLEVGENNLERIDVTIRRTLPDGTVRVTTERGGTAVPFNSRPMRMGAHVFNAIAPPYSMSTVFCRIEQKGLARVSLLLLPAPALFPRVEAQTQVFSLLIGGLILLMVINLFLFLAMRDNVFLWFLLHILFIIGYALSAAGQADRLLWPWAGGMQSRAILFFIVLVMITALLFGRRLLDVKNFSRRLDGFLRYSALAGAILLVIFVLTRGIIKDVLAVYVGISYTALFLTGIMGLRHGRENARAFLAGWGLFLGGFMVRGLALIEVIPASPMSAFLVTLDYGGLILESLVFTFWLIWRLHQLKTQKDEAVAKNRQRQSFIANISHEMRTPLNAIMGISEALQASSSLREVKEGNRKIHQESTRLLFQINQVLDLAKLDADRLQLEHRDFLPREVGEYLAAAYEPLAKAKGLALRFNFDHGQDLLLRGDPGRIEQVLRNLLDNAIKFTETGEVEVSFQAQEFSAGLVRAGWSVRDTGPGIAPEKQAEIFEEFVQADTSITRRYGGTGLGTSIARKLVQVMGGDLHLESKPGNGARFSFTLTLPRGHVWQPGETIPPGGSGPRTAQPAENTVSSGDPCSEKPECCSPDPCAEKDPSCYDACQDDDPAPVPAKPRILVVDDYETNLQVVLLQLKKIPVEIHTASGGAEALEKLAANKYDLVLLDVFMPGLSGYDVVQAMAAKPEWQEIPVVGLTASGYEDDIKAALSAGMRSVLVKPAGKQELLAEIRKYLPGLKVD